MSESVSTQTADQRKQTLANYVAQAVAKGARVESQAEFQAVLVRGKAVNHVLHLALSMFTCGAWLLIWVGLAVFGGEKREVARVDDYGNVLK